MIGLCKSHPIPGPGWGVETRISVARDIPSRPGPITGMGWDRTGKPKLEMGWARVLL